MRSSLFLPAMALSALMLLGLCNTPDVAASVLPGIDVLVSQDFKALQNKRVGLITNHTGRTANGSSTIDILNNAPGVKLVSLFSPEHGIRGEYDGKISSDVDQKTGLPVHSLYGKSCQPTLEMLQGIDVLVFDIQDIGARFYTYIGTLSLAMRAAKEAGIAFVVLDRPNPIGGVKVAGAVPLKLPLEGPGKCGALTSIHAIATRHGMTVGELARMFNSEFGINCELSVVQMSGWNRSMYFDDTGLPWVAPSPNMKTIIAALLYPGLGILESTSLSVGRGTENPFTMFGAPWVDGAAVASALLERRIPGITFVPCSFVPTASGHPYRNKTCHGVCVSAMDRERLDPIMAGLHLTQVLYKLYPQRFKGYEGFSIEVGTERAWELLTRGGKSPADIIADWQQGLEYFKKTRAGYLMY
ncbi:MAG: DUF1343 domain-containing protein [Deltaproteobacteria bacterium]